MKEISKISILFLIVINPFFSQGQSTRFQIGIEGGPSLTMLRDTRFFSFKYSSVSIGLGGSIGVAFQFNFNDKMGIKTNLSFERKGWQNKSSSFHEIYDYLILPVLFKVNFGKKSQTFLNVGPYIGYLLSHYARFDDYNNIYYFNKDENTKIDLGITMGFGINIPLSHHFGLTIEIRDNLGLFDIEKSEEGKTYTNSTIVQLGFVYNFGNRKKG